LSRWWEWTDDEATSTGPLDVQIVTAEAAGYPHVAAIAIEYATAASDSGDRRVAETVLDAAASLPGTAPAVANLRARWLAEAGQHDAAAQLIEDTLAAAPEEGVLSRAEAIARLVEALIRLDRVERARAWVETALAGSGVALDVFERLLFDGYRVRLLRLQGGAPDREHWPPRVEGRSAGEFLFSVGMRANRAGLFLGAATMFDAYVALDAGSEDDLRARAIDLRDRLATLTDRPLVP